jgi:hypothetical protein
MTFVSIIGFVPIHFKFERKKLFNYEQILIFQSEIVIDDSTHLGKKLPLFCRKDHLILTPNLSLS